MKKLFIPSVLLLFCLNIHAQSPAWLWSKSMGSTTNDFAYSIAADGAGDIYTVGTFAGTVDFDPGPGVFNKTAIGSHDIYILKLDASGNFLWANTIGGTNWDEALSVVLDLQGNIYITGDFSDIVDFDPGIGTFILTAAGGSDIFICKMDASGNLIWAKRMGGTGDDSGTSISLDGMGNIYTTGYFIGTVDMDPGTGVYNLTSSGSVFISKLDNAGNFIWAKAFGGLWGTGANAMTVESSTGDVYLTGSFVGTVDFDPSAASLIYTSAGNEDLYISKFDSMGNLVWAKATGGPIDEAGYSIALDATGNVYTTGDFSYATIDFDPGAGVFNMTANGGDVFITKYNSAGAFTWAKQFTGLSSNYASGYGLIVDPINGDLYTIGSFYGDVDFDPGVGNFTLISNNSSDVFVSKLDSAGNFAWVKAAGGTWDDEGHALAISPTGYIYVAGFFPSPTIMFGNNTLVNADNTGLTNDIFIAKLSNVVTGIDNISRKENISVYPNPSSGKFIIAMPANSVITNIEILDMMGKLTPFSSAISQVNEMKQINIKLKNSEEGIYIVRISTPLYTEIKRLVVVE